MIDIDADRKVYLVNNTLCPVSSDIKARTIKQIEKDLLLPLPPVTIKYLLSFRNGFRYLSCI